MDLLDTGTTSGTSGFHFISFQLYGFAPKWRRVLRRPLCWVGWHRSRFKRRGVSYNAMGYCAFCMKEAR